MSVNYAKVIKIQYGDEEIEARALTGRQAERIVELSDDDSPKGGMKIMRYVVACCLLSDGKPQFQGEDEIEQIGSLPFSKIKTVADAVMNEAGLGETDPGN